PSFIFELDVLDRHGICVCVEIRHRAIPRYPAVIKLVSNGQMPSLAVNLKNDILAEILERYLRPEPCTQIPYAASPILKFGVLGDPLLQYHSVVFVSTW